LAAAVAALSNNEEQGPHGCCIDDYQTLALPAGTDQMVCYRYHQGHTAKMPHSTKFLGQTAVHRSADAPNLSTGTADWPMVADANSIDEAPDLPDPAAFPIVGRSISWGHKEASSDGAHPENGNAPEQVGGTFHHRRTATSGRKCWAGAHRDVASERRATKVLQVQRPFWCGTRVPLI
jgi:hypothetical protein